MRKSGTQRRLHSAARISKSLKPDALCVEPQSRKIVFKTAAAFGESDYDIFPVKNETARLRLVP